MTDQASHTRDLRVSDAEREHVTELLQRAVGRGLLSLEEFGERADTALSARTRGELNAVLADLPGLVHRETPAPSRDRLELKNTMSSTKRSGDWAVPRELAVRNRMGSTELDFTEARIPHPEVRIEIDVVAGSVELLVPENASVYSHDVEVTAGSMEDKAGPNPASEEGEPGPRFVLFGTIRAGSVEIRRPRYYRVGKMLFRWPPRVSMDRRREN
jgi:hypothetical protein